MMDMELLPFTMDISKKKTVDYQAQVALALAGAIANPHAFVPFKNTSMVAEMTCLTQDLAMPIKVRNRVVNVVLTLTISCPIIASVAFSFSMDVSMQDLAFIAAVTNIYKWIEISKNVKCDNQVIVNEEELGEPPP